ncbi:MAG TPA: recombinase family protein [Chloroflexia bacterium]|nr:recombinase family protein [Chloroflexia bacterium]
MTSPKPAAIYLRVSTALQASEGTSIQTQLEVCRQYADREGYVVLQEAVDVITGTTVDRQGLDAVRDLAESGDISTVIIYHPDRFGRDAGDALFVFKELKQRGVDLRSATIPLEDSPTGKFFFTILLAVAELERATIIDRTRRGRERRAREGHVISSALEPYGYRYIRSKDSPTGHGMYELVEEEAAIVRLIYEWCVEEGLTVYSIAARLQEARVPTKRGGNWRSSTVHHILASELYTGTWQWNKTRRAAARTHITRTLAPEDRGAPRPLKGPSAPKTQSARPTSKRDKDPSEWIAVTVPAAVSRELYDAAQKQLAQNLERSRRNTKYSYLLSGIIFCARCGRRYYSARGGRGHRPQYRCPNRGRPSHVTPERKCDNTIYDGALLEGEVWKAIQAYLTAPRHILARREAKPGAAEAAAQRIAADLAANDRSLQRLEREEARMLEAYRQEIVDITTLRRETTAIKERRATLEKQRADLNRRLAEGKLSVARQETLEERRWLAQEGSQALDHEGRRKVLNQLEISCHIDENRVTISGMLWHNIVLVFGDNSDQASQVEEDWAGPGERAG